MPYISQEQRELLQRRAQQLGEDISCAGDLNFAIYVMLLMYIEQDKNYQRMNDIIGALDNVKDEFRRRIQHPYEDMKIEENGDIKIIQ